MPTLLLLIIAVLLLPGSAVPALGEEIPVVSLERGVLLYEGFGHWLNVGYDFSDSKSGQSSSSNHAFKESYNASLQIALFDPRIFDAYLQGGIIFDQNWGKTSSSSSSGSSNSYQYNFSGSGLSKSRIPFNLLSFNTSNTVQNNFTPPTTTDNTGNEFSIAFLNDKLKSRFNFSRNSFDTTTSDSSSSSIANAYLYSAEHHYGSFATTFFTASFSDQNGVTSYGDKLTSSNNSLGLSNYLTFGAGQKYSLSSTFQLNNSITDNRPMRNLSYSEYLGAQLGKAMSLDATYSLTNSRSSDRIGPVDENTLNQGNLGISHKLFESLETKVNGAVSHNNENDGTEKKYSVRGNATYNKKLPEGNHLSLGLNKSYELVDRNVSTGDTTVRDELHAGAHQGDVIQLAPANGTLRSVSAVTSRNPIFTYVEGVDYTINYALGRITILSGGGVRIDPDGAGTDLYLTYTLYQDPQLKYSSDSLSLNSNLTLFNNQITLGASWSKSGQTLISGPALNSLQDSRSLMLYVGGNYDTTTTRLSYRNEISGNLTSQSYEGNISTSWQTANAAISLSARDSYNIFDSALTSQAYWDNNADMSISYTRSIMANTKLTLLGTANDSRSELQPTKDSLSLRANCQITLNRVYINLSGQTYWIFDTNGTARNDSFHVDLTRYF